MGGGSQDVDVSNIKDLLLQRLRNKYVATGDLAAVALAVGWAREVHLVSSDRLLYIGGKFVFDPYYSVSGFWKLPSWRRKFSMRLPLMSKGLWGLGDKTYVVVGQEKIEVVVDGKTYLSRTNICGLAESIDSGGRHVVVHVVGTLRGPWEASELYTAFRCSEWLLSFSREHMFNRYAFDKHRVHNDITGERVEFRDVFIKKGRVVDILVNPTCREYMETVYRLYRSYVTCEG